MSKYKDIRICDRGGCGNTAYLKLRGFDYCEKHWKENYQDQLVEKIEEMPLGLKESSKEAISSVAYFKQRVIALIKEGK